MLGKPCRNGSAFRLEPHNDPRLSLVDSLPHSTASDAQRPCLIGAIHFAAWTDGRAASARRNSTTRHRQETTTQVGADQQGERKSSRSSWWRGNWRQRELLFDEAAILGLFHRASD